MFADSGIHRGLGTSPSQILKMTIVIQEASRRPKLSLAFLSPTFAWAVLRLGFFLSTSPVQACTALLCPTCFINFFQKSQKR
jgi:hypothetical protein